MTAARTQLLAISPIYRGLGYVVFDHDGALLDWGTTDTRKFRPKASLKRARALLSRFAPKTLVLELTGTPMCRRKERVRNLISQLALLGEECSVAVEFCDRRAVVQCLELGHSANKDSMARAIADRLAPIAHRLPRPRRIWESEKHAMALFVAAGLALAQLSARRSKLMLDEGCIDTR